MHLLHCAHRGEHTVAHDAVQDSIASIIRDVGFHVLCKQIHVFLAPFLQSNWWRMDIMFPIDDICTLANIIIVDPICANLVLLAASFWRMAVRIAIQAQGVSYRDQHPKNNFVPLAL
jgi:hypothetical protein